MATKKLFVKLVTYRLRRGILYDTRRDAPVEHFIGLNVPTTQQRPKLT